MAHKTVPLTEDMLLTSFGRKPAVRAAITRQWKSAHDAGKVCAVAVRASDFYGPDAPTSVVSMFGVARLLAGKPALTPYSPEQPHDFTFVPRLRARARHARRRARRRLRQAWHIPNAPTRTLRDVLTLAASLIPVRPRLTVFPALLSPIAGLFNKEIRETAEMRFQWDRPYIVDSSRFAARFWKDATPFERGLGETIAFYRGSS